MLEGEINVRDAQGHDDNSERAWEIEIRHVHRPRPLGKFVGEFRAASDDFRGGDKEVASGGIECASERRGTRRWAVRVSDADRSRRQADAGLGNTGDDFARETAMA